MFNNIQGKTRNTQTFIQKENDNQTSVSKFVWTLKRNNIGYNIEWRLIDRAEPFPPISGKCALCIHEQFYIMFLPTSADLNSRSKKFSNCRN